jgi:integrase
MGTIVARKRKDGSTGYTAAIRLKRNGAIVHRETQTFDRKQAAAAWIKTREGQLSQPGELDKLLAPPTEDPPLAAVIDHYNQKKLREHGKTKAQVLQTISRSELGQLKCSQVTSRAIIAFASSLDAQPQTVGNYMSHLSSIFTVARPAWGYPLDSQAMADATVVLKKLGRTSKSKQRTRRPTLGELDRILEHFSTIELKRPDSNPMGKLILFAIFSTRRQEEITRITYSDLNREHLEIIVRDMKNPGEKVGNDVTTSLTPEALRIIDSQKKQGNIIFPYNSQSISAAFTRACSYLGIEDLHFHDLRHDGISRLFEMGRNIPQVACVSGHRSWASLKRYTHMKQSGDKYLNWKWLNKIAPESSQ